MKNQNILWAAGAVVVSLVLVSVLGLGGSVKQFGTAGITDITGLNINTLDGGPGTLTVANGITQTSTSAINILLGSLGVNNLVQGVSGFAQTLSTSVGTSFSITPAQWCSATQVLIPVSNTTTVTLTLPAASTTFSTCGATAGSWATQIIDNESSFAATIATSTGGNGIVFLEATGTTMTTFPPKVLASTTEFQVGSYISSTALNMYRTAFTRITGI